MPNPFEDIRRMLAAGQAREAERLLGTPAFSGRAPRLQVARLANEHRHWWLSEKLARELVARDAEDSEAWSALGFAAFSQGRHREARGAFEKALALNPDYTAARRNLAAVLCDQELSEEALAQADHLMRSAPTPATQRIRARALIQLNRFDEAERTLAQLIDATATDAAAHDLLLRLRQLRGDVDPARALRAAARQPAADPRLRHQWADAMRRLGDNPGSERELRDLMALLGPLPPLLGSLATVLQDDGRMAEALALARQALSLAADDMDIAETFVATAIASGAAAEAIPVVERWRAAQPLDQRWITHRIDAARMLGQSEFEPWWDPARVTRHYDLAAPAGYSDAAGFLAQLRAEVLALHRAANHPLEQSLRQGTQTSRNLLVHPGPAISRLLESFADAVECFRTEVIAALPAGGAAGAHPLAARNHSRAELVGCWSVRLRRGGFHVNHIHPEGWVSSAFYLSVPAEVADPSRRAGWLKFGEPRYPVAGLEPSGFVQPVEGRLVLFPSYLWHGTNPLTSDEPRVSVAFDARPATG
jgi:tetratricopeptide (TPR) repeat protein